MTLSALTVGQKRTKKLNLSMAIYMRKHTSENEDNLKYDMISQIKYLKMDKLVIIVAKISLDHLGLYYK